MSEDRFLSLSLSRFFFARKKQNAVSEAFSSQSFISVLHHLEVTERNNYSN